MRPPPVGGDDGDLRGVSFVLVFCRWCSASAPRLAKRGSRVYRHAESAVVSHKPGGAVGEGRPGPRRLSRGTTSPTGGHACPVAAWGLRPPLIQVLAGAVSTACGSLTDPCDVLAELLRDAVGLGRNGAHTSPVRRWRVRQRSRQPEVDCEFLDYCRASLLPPRRAFMTARTVRAARSEARHPLGDETWGGWSRRARSGSRDASHSPVVRASPKWSSRCEIVSGSMPWIVTTEGELPDEYERREHDTSAAAWSDYWGRILELEIHGYRRDGPEVVESGRAWVHRLRRDVERIGVRIERTA